MALLWTVAVSHSAKPWLTENHKQPEDGHPVPVKEAGFAGYVEAHDPDGELYDRDQGEDAFDEDLWDHTYPEPTPEEQKHADNDKYGDLPDSHHERHERAYSDALEARKDPEPDHHDHGLGDFVVTHGSDTDIYHKHGTFGKVSLRQPVYATQTHVHTGHMDRIDEDRSGLAGSWHQQNMPKNLHPNLQPREYLADKHPLFATHEGRLHVTDGHNRVAAALRRGDPHIEGWHVNLDEHSHLVHHSFDDDEDY